ncbi:MAG TPA: hypothetical protein PLW11_07635, partial [Bacillota bacterium]|nr:hypothetical protein [Bacillota bacterium]
MSTPAGPANLMPAAFGFFPVLSTTVSGIASVCEKSSVTLYSAIIYACPTYKALTWALSSRVTVPVSAIRLHFTSPGLT